MTSLLFLLLVACPAIAEPVNYHIPESHPRSVVSPSFEQEVGDRDVYHSSFARNSETNNYFIYTRLNPTSPQRLVLDDVTSVTASNFDARKPIVVVIHGWVDDANSSFNIAVRDAYLQKKDVNIIMLEWSRLSKAAYWTSVSGVPEVGRHLGQVLSFLNQVTDAPFDDMHLIGFSLGAHVAGNAGRHLGGRVARITGLDPAGPGWYLNSNCLKPSDAVYVEAIHSGADILGLGITSAVGNADFYPNGGNNQPGCSDLFCNHNRAWELFAATVIYDNFVANKCANMIEVYANSCRGNVLNMGNVDINKRGSGLYRVNTNAAYPYILT